MGAKRFSDIKTTGENNIENEENEDKKILGVNINEVVNSIIIILFIIGGITLVGLSIGGM